MIPEYELKRGCCFQILIGGWGKGGYLIKRDIRLGIAYLNGEKKKNVPVYCICFTLILVLFNRGELMFVSYSIVVILYDVYSMFILFLIFLDYYVCLYSYSDC